MSKDEKPKKEKKAPKESAGLIKTLLGEEPEKPDMKKLEEETGAIDKEVEAIKGKLDKLTEEINKRSTGKEEYEAEKKVLQEDFDKAKDTFDNLRDQLYKLTDTAKSQREAGYTAKKEMGGLEREIKQMDEATLEKKIKELEFRMHTTSMSLAAEKACMKEIAELKKKRPEIMKKAEKLRELQKKALGNDASDGTNVEESIQEVKKLIEAAKTDKDSKNDKLKALKEKRQKEQGPIRDLIDKKDKLRSEMKEKRDAKWELNQAFNKIKSAHRDWERKKRDIEWEEQKKREEREWEAWEAEKTKKKLEKQAEKPYFEEMTLLEQTIMYCKGLQKDAGEGPVEEKKVDAAALEGAIGVEGAMVMVSKKDREQEMYLQGHKGKKLKQGGQKKKNRNIKHNAGTFALFAQLKNKSISAPMTLDDVPALLEKLEAEMEVYNKKIADWEVKRDEIQKQIEEADETVKKAQEALAEAGGKVVSAESKEDQVAKIAATLGA